MPKLGGWDPRPDLLIGSEGPDIPYYTTGGVQDGPSPPPIP